jgi:hypothetical protein
MVDENETTMTHGLNIVFCMFNDTQTKKKHKQLNTTDVMGHN